MDVEETDGLNTIRYDGSYHILSSLLGVKYYVETNKLENDPYHKLDKKSDYEIYENKESLELGYLVDNNIIDIELYYYNNDTYIEDIKILKKNQLQVTNISGNKLTGTIDAEKENILFMSCLFNKELEIYVDGKKRKIKNIIYIYRSQNLKRKTQNRIKI